VLQQDKSYKSVESVTISSQFLPLKITFTQFLLPSNLHRQGRTEVHSRHTLILVQAKVTGGQTGCFSTATKFLRHNMCVAEAVCVFSQWKKQVVWAKIEFQFVLHRENNLPQL